MNESGLKFHRGYFKLRLDRGNWLFPAKNALKHVFSLLDEELLFMFLRPFVCESWLHYLLEFSRI